MCKGLRMGGEVVELRNCPVCGNLFVYSFKNMCPDCIKKDEDDFKKVRGYIYKNPNATIEEISEKTEIDTKKVLEFLRDGRLVLKHSNNLLTCEICKQPILTGKYCDRCAKTVKTKLETAAKKSLNTREDMSGKIHLSKFRKDGR
jgi:flagellar operon protein (TIGR03826 family)